RPKGVALEHRGVVNTLLCRKEEYKFTPGVTALQLFSFAFDGFVTSFFTPVISGAKVILLAEEDVIDITHINKIIVKHGVNHFICVPILFKAILDNTANMELKSLKIVTLAGDAVSPDILEHIAVKHIEIAVEYGVTEASVMSTIFRDQGARGKLTIGKPAANTRIYILNPWGRLQIIGVAGELCISSVGLARGYLNQPELTAEKFIDFHHSCLYHTGDLARWLPDGNIEFLGRIDFQAKIRGYRIEVGEIECVLSKHEEIKEVVVMSRQSETGDNYLCAYIVPRVERQLPVSSLREYLMRQLPEYMIPAYFVFLDRISLTPSGKIDRKALPKAGLKPGESYTAPRNEIEKKLVEVWSEVLGRQASIGIDDNFFELGGHSLKATVLVSKIHKEFEVVIPLAEIFKTPRIKELAKYIKEKSKESYASIEPVEEKEYYPLSSAQKRLYILWQMNPDSTAYNMPEIIPLPAESDLRKIEETFKKLIKRHESLRTSFQLVNNTPVQVIHGDVRFEIEYFATDEHGQTRTFNPGKAPLLRVGLLRLAENRHLLMVDMHHIIADGISVEIMIKDFMALYNGEKLPAQGVTYKDYSEWQRGLAVNGSLAPQESYWLQEFQGEIPVLNLPTDYVRPKVQSFAGRTLNFVVKERETQGLKDLASAEGATLFMVLLAVYNMFLARLSGQEVVTVGTPTAGRRHADLGNIIGMFVNTLALKNEPRGGKRFREFLGDVKEKSLAAFANQDYQYEELVERLRVNRDTGRNPLFDTVFALQNIDIPEIHIPGLKLAPYPYEQKIAKFDLYLECIETGENLSFTFEYCTELFKEETVRRFAGYFKRLLASVLESPGGKISDGEIIPGDEKAQLLFQFNDTATAYPHDKTIQQLFAEQAIKTPDRIAVFGRGRCERRERRER
ncbi:MAG TPA: condensation domain-containing protein, partial [Candidatus Deferrimicrobium sp.]|nr:condensation domain-containing protein [Candidatus Deferrimicrobium sp.]